jgi:hypothetical protein
MSELLRINVNEKTEKKNGLTYLSWAWAWAEVLKHDPEADWEAVEYPQPDGTLAPCMYLGNGTAMVKTRVTIKGRSRVCMLPVMDHRNKAIPQPDAFAVNTAIMRCMTKALAMHGLGLYIYAGEDLPEPEPESDAQRAERERKEKRGFELEQFALDIIDMHQRGKDLDAFKAWYSAEAWAADHDEANEERLYVWGVLKNESKLRSAIKANKPVDKAEAWKAGQQVEA